MLVTDKYHLTYCTNIHPGKDWELTFTQLQTHVPTIKAKLAPTVPFGLGLRLSNLASEELDAGENLKHFKHWLQDNDIYVFTMNGFPYGNFHNESVKDKVHAPDWTTKERVVYTKRLFRQLAYLLPEGISGGISTSPISYKHWYPDKKAIEKAFSVGAEHLVEIILTLFTIEKETGKYLHLDIEPEPDGLIENSDEVVHFFTNFLLPLAVQTLKKELNVTTTEAEALTRKYITVCYDVCHFSLAYEEPEYTLQKFKKHHIQVGKIQVSSALKIIFNEKDTTAIWKSLARFNESTYLHQVTEKVEGKVKTYNDLPVVLEQKQNFKEIRAHFHVPIFLEKFDKLFSTQDQILNVITYLKEEQFSEHLEIETYTWDVLPENLKANLSDSIIREMEWLLPKL